MLQKNKADKKTVSQSVNKHTQKKKRETTQQMKGCWGTRDKAGQGFFAMVARKRHVARGDKEERKKKEEESAVVSTTERQHKVKGGTGRHVALLDCLRVFPVVSSFK